MDQKKIRTLVAEDEPAARRKLLMLLRDDPAIQVVGECATGEEVKRALGELRPDLVFMDIEMPDQNGLELLQRMNPASLPVVVFTTAYDQYALQAFESDAVDYLLKPFGRQRLDKALQKVKAHLWSGRSDLALHIQSLLRVRTAARVKIKSQGKLLFFGMSEIDWIEAASNYVRFHIKTQTHLVRQTLAEVENRLDPSIFVRIHRSVIVNVDKIRAILPCNSGEFMVTLAGGKELPSSRGYRDNLTKLISESL